MRRRGQRRRAAQAALAAVTAAAAMAACVGDEPSFLLPDSGAGAGADATANHDAPAADADAEPDPSAADGAPDHAADVESRPSYCAGLTLYAPLDGDLSNVILRQGGSWVPGDGGAMEYVDAGLFGQALRLTGLSEIHYDATFFNAAVYRNHAGSFAVWAHMRFPVCDGGVPSQNFVFIGNRMTGVGGPNVLYSGGKVFELKVPMADTDSGFTLVDRRGCDVAPFWSDDGYDQLVATWTEGQSARLVLNGGDDGNTGALTLALDASWGLPDGSPVERYVAIGDRFNPTAWDYDEAAIWDRPLAPAEIAALHAAQRPPGGKPLGALCPGIVGGGVRDAGAD